MTIELSLSPGNGPFVWPEEPDDFRPWQKEQFDNAQEEQGDRQERAGREGARMWPKDEGGVRGMARSLLKGRGGGRGGQ